MSQQERATILLIDDHPMLRTGVKQLISMAPDIQVIGEASNGAQGIELAESLDPAGPQYAGHERSGDAG